MPNVEKWGCSCARAIVRNDIFSYPINLRRAWNSPRRNAVPFAVTSGSVRNQSSSTSVISKQSNWWTFFFYSFSIINFFSQRLTLILFEAGIGHISPFCMKTKMLWADSNICLRFLQCQGIKFLWESYLKQIIIGRKAIHI